MEVKGYETSSVSLFQKSFGEGKSTSYEDTTSSTPLSKPSKMILHPPNISSQTKSKNKVTENMPIDKTTSAAKLQCLKRMESQLSTLMNNAQRLS